MTSITDKAPAVDVLSDGQFGLRQVALENGTSAVNVEADLSVRLGRRGRQSEADIVSGTEDEGENDRDEERDPEGSADRTIEQVEREIVDPDRRRRLADQLDGKTADIRSPAEQRAIERGLTSVQEKGDLNIQVVSVDQGENVILQSNDGGEVAARLGSDRRSYMTETTDGKKVLLMDANLSEAEAVTEVSLQTADIIAVSVQAAGIAVSSDFRFLFVNELFKALQVPYRQYVMDYTTYLWRSTTIREDL